MTTKLSDFMKEIEAEAQAEGTEAVEQLESLRAHFRVGRELVEARRTLKLTQTQVAARANVDQAVVSKIERGVANPTLETMCAVASAVHMGFGFKART